MTSWTSKVKNKDFEVRALSSVGWGTTNFKLKGWCGKLDLSGKGRGLRKEGSCLVWGWGTPILKLEDWDGMLDLSGKGRGLRKEGRSLVSGGAHQFLNSRVGMGSWTSEGNVKRT